jgi:hypothetical protein
MKKKLMVGVVLACLILTLGVSFAMAPEFTTAKNIAMTAQQDEDGNYLTGKVTAQNGVKVAYVVSYMPNVGLVGGSIVNGDRIYSVYFDENEKAYFAEIGEVPSMKQLAIKKISEEDAVKLLRSILKQLTYSAISY